MIRKNFLATFLLAPLALTKAPADKAKPLTATEAKRRYDALVSPTLSDLVKELGEEEVARLAQQSWIIRAQALARGYRIK